MRFGKTLISAAVVAFALMAAGPAPASGTHWCRQGDPQILASAKTSCQFAGNAVNRYYRSARGRHYFRAWVSSPVTHKSYLLTYRRGGDRFSGDVTATGVGGIWLRFNWAYYG
ncbi:MAG: hypothetical protein ACXWQ5_18505 [Ktedonobacterales bacterium]